MKKAQIKMFETIGVLVVFFFLIVIGLSFYFVIAKKGVVEQHEKIAQLKGIEIIRKSVTLPELNCARVGVQVENCFDKLKIKHFSALLQEDPRTFSQYNPFFGTTEVTVQEIFPEEKDPITLFSNPLDDAGFDLAIVPILLFDPITDSFDFAVMEVKHFQRDIQ